MRKINCFCADLRILGNKRLKVDVERRDFSQYLEPAKSTKKSSPQNGQLANTSRTRGTYACQKYSASPTPRAPGDSIPIFGYFYNLYLNFHLWFFVAYLWGEGAEYIPLLGTKDYLGQQIVKGKQMLSKNIVLAQQKINKAKGKVNGAGNTTKVKNTVSKTKRNINNAVKPKASNIGDSARVKEEARVKKLEKEVQELKRRIKIKDQGKESIFRDMDKLRNEALRKSQKTGLLVKCLANATQNEQGIF